MAETEFDAERLRQPLTILRDVSQRLLQRQIPSTQGRLDELYSHISGAIGDAIEYAQSQFDLAKETMLGGADELAHSGTLSEEGHEALLDFSDEFEQAQADLREALEMAKETFFSAGSFQELQARQPYLAIVESRLETSLQVLQATLMRLESPALLISYVPSAAQVPQAVDEIGLGLDLISHHLEKGERASLEAALERLKSAQSLIEEALAATP